MSSPHKVVKTNRYIIDFNTNSGVEVLTGINGNPDPFMLDFPSMLDIGIMGTCQNSCSICYQGNDNQPNMSFEDFKQIIDEAQHNTMQVALGGRGDPNLHENFKEIIEYCKSHNIVPNYTTSGNNLTDEQIEISKFCGAVAVSYYNKDFTYTALNKFMKAGIKTNIHFVVTSKSYTEAISLLNGEDIWKGKVDISKLNAVIFLLFKPQGRGKEQTFLVPNNDQISNLINLVRQHKTSFKVGFDSCMINRMKTVTEFKGLEQICMDTCEGGRMSSYITPDMKFLPCSFGDHSYGIPINSSNISTIWNTSDLFIDFRNLLKTNPFTCPYNL